GSSRAEVIAGHYPEHLFAPRSVALVGASEHPQKVGGRVLENLVARGFTGTLFAVNPRHRQGRPVACHPASGAGGEPGDPAVIATPAATVPAIVEQCGRAGVRHAVVLSAGFAEAGAEGVKREAELLAAAREHGVRILGPNCVGIIRPALGLDATFARGGALPG